MADPLSLDTYVVQRVFKMGGLRLAFNDSSGNQVLKSEGKMLVTQQPLQTMDGRVISTITHKIVAATPEYDVHAGDAKGNVTGIVKVPMQLMQGFAALNAIDIKDAGGNVIATANGNFLDMEFDIRDSKGNAVAKVTRKMDASGMLGKVAQFGSNTYSLSVTGKSIPTQALLEFLIVLELLLAKGQGSSPGLIGGQPNIGGFGLPGGFGGGGGIQL